MHVRGPADQLDVLHALRADLLAAGNIGALRLDAADESRVEVVLGEG